MDNRNAITGYDGIFEKFNLKKLFFYEKVLVNRNPQRNGDHEVHDENGVYLPIIANCNYLGVFYLVKVL